MKTSEDSYERTWNFLTEDIIIEVEEIPRLEIQVIEANDLEFETATLFDGSEVLQ